MTNLKPYQQDTLRHLLTAFDAAPEPVRREALHQLNARANTARINTAVLQLAFRR